MKREVTITINGNPYHLLVDSRRTLLEVIREEAGLTGAKLGCGMGECGACTVILDGRTVNSCLVLAVEADGAVVETIENLARDGRLHPLQEAFINHGAIQCGFCTPGMIMSAKGLLDRNPKAATEEIRSGMRGNLCRCTGYVKIVEAIESVRDGGEK
ncbi:MAG: (2Fe-2S)-binding protein [Thermodesulfobacteriota bacterium]